MRYELPTICVYGVPIMDKIQHKFIQDALDDPSDLTEWEYEFVNSLAGKPDDYKLSEKQAHILNRISQKYV